MSPPSPTLRWRPKYSSIDSCVCTYHDVYTEITDEIGGRLPAEHVVERRAPKRVASVQVDGGRAVRDRSSPFADERGAQPGETADARTVAVGVAAARLLETGVHVVSVQHGEPEPADRWRQRWRRRRYGRYDHQ